MCAVIMKPSDQFKILIVCVYMPCDIRSQTSVDPVDYMVNVWIIYQNLLIINDPHAVIIGGC